MKKQALAIIFFLSSSSISIAGSETDITKHPDLQKEFSLQPYKTLKMLAFNDYRSDIAYTYLYKEGSEKADASYFVSINPSPNGPFLFFNATESCIPDMVNENDIININGKNIKTKSICLKAEGKNEQSIGFTIKSEEGKLYVIEQFQKSEFVKVKFRGKTIPFETGSFNEAWQSASSPAL